MSLYPSSRDVAAPSRVADDTNAASAYVLGLFVLLGLAAVGASLYTDTAPAGAPPLDRMSPPCSPRPGGHSAC